jgi:hypothetical protein
MAEAVEFEVLTSCFGADFSYQAGQRITLGVDISAATATDLLRAGHIIKILPSGVPAYTSLLSIRNT